VFSAGARRAVLRLLRGGALRTVVRAVGDAPPVARGHVRGSSCVGCPPVAARMGGAVSPPCTGMFVSLAGSELDLGTGTTASTTQPAPSASDEHFLTQTLARSLPVARELAVDAFSGPILRGAAATPGEPVDRHGAAILDGSQAPSGGASPVRCGLLYRRWQGASGGLCIPAGGGLPGLRAQVLRECRDGPLARWGDVLGGPPETVSLVRRLAFWARQDVAEYVRTCQTCQRGKAERGGPRGLLSTLSLYRHGEGGCLGWTGSPGFPRRQAASTRSRITWTPCRARCTWSPPVRAATGVRKAKLDAVGAAIRPRAMSGCASLLREDSEVRVHCPEKVAEYDAAAPRRRAARRGYRAQRRFPCPPLGPEPGWWCHLRSGRPRWFVRQGIRWRWPLRSGRARRWSDIGCFRCWPAEGWVRGRAGRVSRAAGFSHVVGYGPTSVLGAAAVASMLDDAAAPHGPAGPGRWVLLLPTR
jgi:hypothetical protein